MTYNLDRFITAQLRDYKQAYKEIKNGKKITHWMWYIFPQLKGLGSSEYAEYYGLESIEEAKAYWDNDYLRNNLTKICECLLTLEGKTAEDIFGYVDSLKLKSCMTLFLEATKEKIFYDVLDKYYNQEPLKGGDKHVN
ncbi:MAG: DUF1810 domain-containing protein [Paludibacteraceae bacterium]|nr:DUF1810 domain-containing protein [Paludibacteraceae bacterium]